MNINRLIIQKIHKFIRSKSRSPKRIVLGWRDNTELENYFLGQTFVGHTTKAYNEFHGLPIKLAKCEKYIRIV